MQPGCFPGLGEAIHTTFAWKKMMGSFDVNNLEQVRGGFGFFCYLYKFFIDASCSQVKTYARCPRDSSKLLSILSEAPYRKYPIFTSCVMPAFAKADSNPFFNSCFSVYAGIVSCKYAVKKTVPLIQHKCFLSKCVCWFNFTALDSFCK